MKKLKIRLVFCLYFIPDCNQFQGIWNKHKIQSFFVYIMLILKNQIQIMLAIFANFEWIKILKKPVPTFSEILQKVKIIVLPIAIILRLNPIEIPQQV